MSEIIMKACEMAGMNLDIEREDVASGIVRYIADEDELIDEYLKSVDAGVKTAIEISKAQHKNMIPLDLPSEGSYSITRLLQMRIRCISCPQHHPASA